MNDFDGQGENVRQVAVDGGNFQIKGILFAILGMIVGVALMSTIGGFSGLRWTYTIGGGALGLLVSKVYKIGNEKQGILGQVIVVTFSIIGVILAVLSGYAIYIYRLFGISLLSSFDLLIQFVGNGLANIFSSFRTIFDDTNLENMIVSDIIFGSGVAASAALKGLSFKNKSSETTLADEEDFEL